MCKAFLWPACGAVAVALASLASGQRGLYCNSGATSRPGRPYYNKSRSLERDHGPVPVLVALCLFPRKRLSVAVLSRLSRLTPRTVPFETAAKAMALSMMKSTQ